MFTPRKYQVSDAKSAIMDNSENLDIGEVIIPGVTSSTNVVKTGGGTTGLLLGIVMGFKDANGISLEKNSYAASGSNVTGNQVRAEYHPLAVGGEYLTELSAAANTTAGSGEFGNFAVDSTGLLLAETSYVAFGTRTNVQFFSYGLTGDPLKAKQVHGVFFATVGY
jgi:hypothetical protein